MRVYEINNLNACTTTVTDDPGVYYVQVNRSPDIDYVVTLTTD